MKKLKQILSNKNTVTLFGAVLIVLVLYAFYNIRLNQAISPIRVPYAIQEIPPRTKITNDMIGYLEITQNALKGDVYTNVKTQIIEKNMYTNANCTIPAGSLFYTKLLINETDLQNSYTSQIADGMLAYNFDVSMESTYGNSMYPGNEVDLYFRGIDSNGLIMVGKFYEKIKVLDVKDSSGRPVFEGTTEVRTPSQMILEVDNECHLVLRAAEKLSDVEIILVPYGTTLSSETDEEKNKVVLTHEEIKQYIESRATLIQ